MKKASDENGILRVSIGGAASMGYYLVYRGGKEEAITMLAHALIAMRGMAQVLGPDKEPDIEPENTEPC